MIKAIVNLNDLTAHLLSILEQGYTKAILSESMTDKGNYVIDIHPVSEVDYDKYHTSVPKEQLN